MKHARLGCAFIGFAFLAYAVKPSSFKHPQLLRELATASARLDERADEKEREQEAA